MFAAFGIRRRRWSPSTCGPAARRPTGSGPRLLEMCEREGIDFVTGAVPPDADGGRAGRPGRLASWPDGVYRCVHVHRRRRAEAGPGPQLLHDDDQEGRHLHVDFTGTSPETPSSYNAHPQAVIGHLANYIYEYVFHDLPISSRPSSRSTSSSRRTRAVPRRPGGDQQLGDGGHRGDERDRQLCRQGACSPRSTGGRSPPRRATAGNAS